MIAYGVQVQARIQRQQALLVYFDARFAHHEDPVRGQGPGDALDHSLPSLNR